QEHARPLQIHEHEAARRRGRFESLRPSRIADAGSARRRVGLRSGWGLSALRHVDLLASWHVGPDGTWAPTVPRGPSLVKTCPTSWLAARDLLQCAHAGGTPRAGRCRGDLEHLRGYPTLLCR